MTFVIIVSSVRYLNGISLVVGENGNFIDFTLLLQIEAFINVVAC